MPLTVDWNWMWSGESEGKPSTRYPQPIAGYLCSRCTRAGGKSSHNCADLTCSCECPDLGLSELPANVVPEQEFDGNPFHGRRREVDAVDFFPAAMPQMYGRNSHKMHRIPRSPWAHKRSSVNPYLWRLSLRMHDHLIYMACSRSSYWLPSEIQEIWDADKELQREINWRHAEAQRVATEFKIPVFQSGQKWNCLRALIAEPADSHMVAATTGLPQKHVSAWLSLLEGQGYIRRVDEERINKAPRKNIIWEACWMEVLKLNETDQQQTDVR